MRGGYRKKDGPKDAATSKGPNAKAQEAFASRDFYTKPNRHGKEKPTAGGMTDFAHSTRPRKYVAITRKLEGEYRHARYRLVTPGRLMIQTKNRQGTLLIQCETA